MAVVSKETHSIQAVSGKHPIIEGRAVVLTDEFIDDLPVASYPNPNTVIRVWVALCPPDTFVPPIPHSLYVASKLSVYDINDPAIYSNPIITEEYKLVNHSQLRLPIIHRYERVALYRGLIGVCGACHQDNPDVLVPGNFLTVNQTGLFRKVDKNHPNVVAQTAYYNIKGGLLYINVF